MEEEVVGIEGAAARIDIEVRKTSSGDDMLLVVKSESKEEDASKMDDDLRIVEYSDLRSGPRKIWIVTTAGLPWRTGTAVNPLWRAVHLALDGHNVVLMIPWLTDINSRKKLYGAKNSFANGPEEQIEWIFKEFIGIDRSQATASSKLVQNLHIKFWNGIYQESFGSIFPVEDICSLIPSDAADVAILEEPEHLNWFRIVPPYKNAQKSKIESFHEGNENCENKQSAAVSQTNISTQDETDDTTSHLYDCPSISGASIMDKVESNDPSDGENNEVNTNALGWASKFRYVIGILHTNYGDYIRQYGMMGTSFLGASALQALSTLVVRAYCHKVIRLSDTLPSFWTANHSSQYKYPPNTTLEGVSECMETTCNVHGVRDDFLNPAIPKPSIDPNETKPATVYFIGKLIWAKGFEQVLEVQELYRTDTTDYFEMDIYGSGNDEKAIQRAFLGRHGQSRDSATSPTRSDSSFHSRPTSPEPDFVEIGKNTTSLRSQIDSLMIANISSLLLNPTTPSTDSPPSAEHKPTSTEAIETSLDGKTTSVVHNNESENCALPLVENLDSKDIIGVDPLNILGDVSQKTIGTTVETADAAMKMVESIMQFGLGAFGFGGSQRIGKATLTASKEVVASSPDTGSACLTEPTSATDVSMTKTTSAMEKQLPPRDPPVQQQLAGIPFTLAPARARFKWRRYPIPARFLGVQDHIIVRDIPEHKGTIYDLFFVRLFSPT